MSDHTILHPTGQRLQTIGRYQLVRRIGRGGMGDVWLCEDPRLKRRVAIKALPPISRQDSELVQRFEREARAVAALTHPHILPVHDYGRQQLADSSTLTYLVMPYLSGGSLGARLTAYQDHDHTMPAQEAFRFLKQVAEAIDYAHQKQIIHRDIKPSNMLLREDGWLLLGDFGIARLVNASERLTKTGQSIGTPEYMAPEQIQGKASVTSDNYSLAVIVYQIFTGRVPFQAETAIATLLQHLTTPPPLPQQFNPGLSGPFTQVLLRGLDKDPEQRPALASEFIAQLERAYFDAYYQPTPLRTIRDLPALAFMEEISTVRLKREEKTSRAGLSRRQLVFGAGVASAMLAGAALGSWGVVSNIQNTSPEIPAQPMVSARPVRTGTNLPALVLTGHSRVVSGLVWTHDSQALISCGNDGQVLHWDISRLIQQPDKPYGTTLYSSAAPGFLSTALNMAQSLDGTMVAISNTDNTNRAQITICTPELRVITQFEMGKDPATSYEVLSMSWLPGNYLMFALWEALPDGNTFQQTVYVINPVKPQQQWIVGNVAVQTKSTDESLRDIVASSSATSMTRALVYDKHIVIGDVKIASQASWQARASIPHNFNLPISSLDVAVCWSADGKSIIGMTEVTSGVYQPTYIDDWQASKPQMMTLQKLNTKDTNYPPLPACNPLAGTRSAAFGTTLGEVFLCDLKPNALSTRKLESGGIVGYIYGLSWSPDGRWLAAGIDDRNFSIVVWKL